MQKTNTKKLTVVLIAELDISDVLEASLEDTAQLKLDSFREAVQPNQYGVSLYRATENDIADHLGGRVVDPDTDMLPAMLVTE